MLLLLGPGASDTFESVSAGLVGMHPSIISLVLLYTLVSLVHSQSTLLSLHSSSNTLILRLRTEGYIPTMIDANTTIMTMLTTTALVPCENHC